MLYAGTTLISSFKYFNLNDTVKKLKQWGKSAGDRYIKYETSETLRNETVVNTENVKLISVHVPKHSKPLCDDQFGHYLAGLIDGGGEFNGKQQLVIVFHSLDASLAYYIKRRLGFGSVRKVKDGNAFLLIIAAKKGMEKVINLINKKIRTESKLDQIKDNILNNENYLELREKIDFKMNFKKDLKNHWLAGFSDALSPVSLLQRSCSFQIKILNSSDKVEVRLNFKIVASSNFVWSLPQKNNILLLIKDFLGGSISCDESKNEYTYSSDSSGSGINVINYFDRFHLLSSKHIHYLKWRKAHLIVQSEGYPLSYEPKRISKLKSTMNRLNDTTV